MSANHYTARWLVAQCIVIGPVCVCVTVCLWRAGGQCPKLTTAVFVSLSAFSFCSVFMLVLAPFDLKLQLYGAIEI